MMTAPHDHDAPVSQQPHEVMDNPGQPQVSIPLTTSVHGNRISIVGNGDATLPQDQGATVFNFTLSDTSGGNVKFASLDTADNMTSCPTTGSGNQSRQIVGIVIGQDGLSARFTDNNSNLASNGPLNVSYQWNFTCSATFNVQPFDPVISNGGRTGPIL
jgi:hypothetical protein